MFGRRRLRADGEGLVVGPTDAVEGTITAEAVTVVGRTAGTLDVATTLHVAATGRVDGTVRATRLVIEAGARVRAACRVGTAATVAEQRSSSVGAVSGVMRLTPRSVPRVETPAGGPAAAHG